MSINLTEIEEARSAIAALARQMLDGGLSYIEGSRAVLAKLPAARVDNMDEFMAFVGIDNETDRLSIGAVRDLRQPDALREMRSELYEAEALAKLYGEPACVRVIERFKERPSGDF